MKKILTLLITATSSLSLASCAQEDFFEKVATFQNETIKNITIDVTNRALNITKSDKTYIEIFYYESKSNKLTYEVNENSLMVSLNTPNNIFGTQAELTYRTISIVIPADLSTSLSLKTSNENCRLEDLSFNSLSIENNNGDINFKNISTISDATFINKDGNIIGNIIGSWDDYAIETSIKKGESNLPELKEEGSKKLKVDNNNGNIQIEISKTSK